MFFWISVAGLIISICGVLKKVKGFLLICSIWLLSILSSILILYTYLDWAVFIIGIISSLLVFCWIVRINEDKERSKE